MKRYIFTFVACMLVFVAMAQTRVKGTVLDAIGEPVIGASVVEKGKTSGVNTDIDGNFSIEVKDLNSILVINYVGMQPMEYPLKGQSQVEITLKEDSQLLDELVVVGYGVQKKINATGAVKTIDNEVLESRPVTNAVQGLQGAIAGLNITNDNGGELGQSMKINIRGVGSIGEGSSSSPLVLIDGMEGDLSSINPSDIATISVLKDAAAASIYGSRAPFGVILVTTKSGDKETRVTYSGNVRVQQPLKVPDVVDSYTFALMMNDAYINTGAANVMYGQALLDKILQFQRGEINYGTEPLEDGSDWKKEFMTFGNTNWYDLYLKKNAVSQEHNFSVSGGNDKVGYYFSGGFLDQSGLFNFADEKYQRLSLSGRVNVKFNKYVSLTWTSRYIHLDNEKPSAMDNTFYHNLARRYPGEVAVLPTGEYSKRSMIESIKNGGRQDQKNQSFFNQLNLLITPVTDWQIHADLGSRIENNPSTRQFKPVYYTKPNGDIEYYTVIDGVASRHEVTSNGSFNVSPAPGENYYETAHNSVNYFTTNVYTDYQLTLNDVHNFKFLLGEQSEYYKYHTLRMASSTIELPEKPFIPGVRGDETTMTSDRSGEWSSFGVFARVNYNYDDRYMAEVNFRGDAASRFPKSQRWGWFPSFSAGWNIAQEEFWRPLANKGLGYLKVRASYGTLGNQNTTSYYPYYQAMQTVGGNVVLGGSQATMLPVYSPFSTSLTWEKIENIGAGIDWGFFNHRLTGSFDWYQRTTKDMVGPAKALPGVFGDSAPKTNNAELRTRGWELEVSWNDRLSKDFSYGISASLSDYKTIITKYDSSTNSIDGWYAGKTYGDFYGYKTIGIAKSDDEMREHLANASQSALGDKWGGGDLMYVDVNNDGSVDGGSGTLEDHGDRVLLGNDTPRYAYSFTLEARWKFIDFRAFFQGIGKRDLIFRTDNSMYYGFGNQYNIMLLYDHLDYFRYAGSELGANMDDPYYARLRYDNANRQQCDRFLQNGAYLRCKNIQIGFNLPENTSLKKYVKKARLYLSGENLFTISSLRIYDPEAIGNTDVSYIGKTYPQYRTWAEGLELTF